MNNRRTRRNQKRSTRHKRKLRGGAWFNWTTNNTQSPSYFKRFFPKSKVNKFWPFTRKSTQENNEQNVKIDKHLLFEKKKFGVILTQIDFMKENLNNKYNDPMNFYKINNKKIRELMNPNTTEIMKGTPQYLIPKNFKYIFFKDQDIIYHYWLISTGESGGDLDSNRHKFLTIKKKEWKDINEHLDAAKKFYFENVGNTTEKLLFNEAQKVQESLRLFYNLSFPVQEIYSNSFRELFSEDKILYGENGEELTGENQING